MGKAHIFQSLMSGDWFLRLIAPNGEIIAASEGHKNKQDVVDLAEKYFPQFTITYEAEPS